MANFRGGGSSGRRAWAIGLCLFLAAGLGQAGPGLPDTGWREFRIVDLGPRDPSSIKISSAIEDLSGFRDRFHNDTLDGQPVYVFERVESTKNGDRHFWKLFLSSPRLTLLRLEKKTVSRSGQTVRELWMDYRDPMFNYPKNLCHVYTIVPYLMGLPLKPAGRYDFWLLLTDEAAPWHMFIVVDGEETVTVPAGKFNCFKVRLEPDYDSIMGKWSWAGPMIKPFVPEYFLWVEKAPPHLLALFQGSFGPVGGAPPQRHELVKVYPPGKAP